MRKVAVHAVVYLEVPTGGMPSAIHAVTNMIKDRYNQIEEIRETSGPDSYPGPRIIGYDTLSAEVLPDDFEYN